MVPRIAPVGADPTAWWRTQFLRAVRQHVPAVLTCLRDRVLRRAAEGIPADRVDRLLAAWRRQYSLHVADPDDDWVEARVRLTLEEWGGGLPPKNPADSELPPDEEWGRRIRRRVSLMTHDEWRRWVRPVKRGQIRSEIRATRLGRLTQLRQSGPLHPELLRGTYDEWRRSVRPVKREQIRNETRATRLERLTRLRQWGPWHPALLRWSGPYHLAQADAVTTDVRFWKEVAHVRWLAQWQCGRWTLRHIAEHEVRTSRETLRLLAQTCEDESLDPKLIILRRGEPWVSDRERALWEDMWDLDADGLDSHCRKMRALLRLRDSGKVPLALGSVTRAIAATAREIGLVRRVGRRGRPRGGGSRPQETGPGSQP